MAGASDLSSYDVRQCPDGGRSTSGCVGGAAIPCKEHLSGPYCRLCNDTEVPRYYNLMIPSANRVPRLLRIWLASG